MFLRVVTRAWVRWFLGGRIFTKDDTPAGRIERNALVDISCIYLFILSGLQVALLKQAREAMHCKLSAILRREVGTVHQLLLLAYPLL